MTKVVYLVASRAPLSMHSHRLTHTHLGSAQAQAGPDRYAETQRQLDLAIEEFRAMKMQPASERALSYKGLLHA
jgi:hypothetical protein